MFLGDKACLACDSEKLVEMLDLGLQPKPNYYSQINEPQAQLPLKLLVCEDCGHAQQGVSFDPDEIFTEYHYESSVSETLKNYSKGFAMALSKAMPKGSKVLEIASNDGILIRELLPFFADVTGVEPSSRIAARAHEEGLPIEIGFWPEVTAAQNQYDVIVAQNVLAHTPRPHPFLMSAARCLSENGVILAQTSQADMLSDLGFDTIYHEHYSFFCDRSAAALAERSGLSVHESILLEIHGKSRLYLMGKNNASSRSIAGRISCAFKETLELSEKTDSTLIERRHVSDWELFSAKSSNIIEALRNEVHRARAANLRIIAIGASAKGLTAIRATGVTVDIALDEASSKVGRYVPGVESPIFSLTGLRLDKNDVFVMTSWNFRKEMASKILELHPSLSENTVISYDRGVVLSTLGEATI